MQQIVFKLLNKIYRTNLKHNSDQNGRSAGIQRYNEYYTARYATDDPRTRPFIQRRSDTNNCAICMRTSDRSVWERSRVQKDNRQISTENGHQLLPLEHGDFKFDATSYL